MRAILAIFRRLPSKFFFIPMMMKSSHEINSSKVETWSVSNTQKQMASWWLHKNSKHLTLRYLSVNTKAYTRRKVTQSMLYGKSKEKPIQTLEKLVQERKARNRYQSIGLGIFERGDFCLSKRKRSWEKWLRFRFWDRILRITKDKRKLFITRFSTLYPHKSKSITTCQIKSATS